MSIFPFRKLLFFEIIDNADKNHWFFNYPYLSIFNCTLFGFNLLRWYL